MCALHARMCVLPNCMSGCVCTAHHCPASACVCAACCSVRTANVPHEHLLSLLLQHACLRHRVHNTAE